MIRLTTDHVSLCGGCWFSDLKGFAMNRFLAANLKKRAEVVADAHNLAGVEREVFVFVAVNSSVGFKTLMMVFELSLLLTAMESLMKSGLVFQMHSSDYYYAKAI